MTLPPAAEAAAVDPFGLWRLPAAAAGDTLSFAVPEGAPQSGIDVPAAVWTLDLTSGPGGRVEAGPALDRLAGQVRAIQAGLDTAVPRVEVFLAARAGHIPAADAASSFTAGAEVPQPPPLPVPQPPPEAGLDLALNLLDPAFTGDAMSFGLPEIAGINWEELYQRLSTLFDSVNRQVLHFAWVDTTLDGRLIARTAVNWGGDFDAIWQAGLSPEQAAAHCRSLALALEARLANLRAILTVSQIAGKIALAAATPLGPLQAMSLAWQFLNTVIKQLESNEKPIRDQAPGHSGA